MRQKATYLSLFIKALLPRFLFIGHGLICIWVVYLVEKNSTWWVLVVSLVAIVAEGVHAVLVRKGQEFDWICPSAFFYSIVLMTTLISFRRDQVKCIADGIDDGECKVITDPTANKLTRMMLGINMGMKALYIEQTGVLMLIIGRWTLPKGSISRDQFSQVLLIYIATAADIIEFSETYTDGIVRSRPERTKIYSEVMAIWGWSLLQFSFTVALPEEGLKQESGEDRSEYNSKWRHTNRVAPISYQHYKAMLTKGWHGNSYRNNPGMGQLLGGGIGNKAKNEKSNEAEQSTLLEEEVRCCISKREWKSCLARNLELIRCLIPVLMQDGPFFGYRMVLIIRYNVITPMIILLTVKNALVIIVQIYRIVILYCSEEPDDEADVNDPSIRVRAALREIGRLTWRYTMATAVANVQAMQDRAFMRAERHHKPDVTA